MYFKNLKVYDLDNCVLYQSLTFHNIRLQPNGDFVFEILVICLSGLFEEKGFQVLLRLQRAQISPANGRGEVRG